MSYVAINVLSVPAERASTLEERFAARQGAVDSADGFEHFELLRPLEGTQDYLVYTRWRSEQDFVAWRDGQRFADGHAASTARPAGAGPAASGSSIWAFEVAQTSSANPTRDATPPAEPVEGVLTTDPGPQQAAGQGEVYDERPPEDPDGPPPVG